MKQSKEFRIGVFVIAVLALSFFVINFLRGKDIFNKEMTLVTSYSSIDGLVESDPVYIKGYKAGSVRSVEYNPETGEFDVECSVLRKFRISEDSRMTIYSRDIMGGKAIRIDQGASSGLVKEGGRLEPGIQPDMLASLAGQISPLLEKITHTAGNLDSITASVNMLLGPEGRSEVQSLLKNLNETAAQARTISEAIGGRSDELASFIDNLTAVSSRLDSIAVKADSAIGDIGSVASVLNESDIEGLVHSFRTLLESMQNPEGTLGRLMADDGVYESIDSLISEADSLLRKIQDNPKKYIRISVF